MSPSLFCKIVIATVEFSRCLAKRQAARLTLVGQLDKSAPMVPSLMTALFYIGVGIIVDAISHTVFGGRLVNLWPTGVKLSESFLR